ARARWPCWSSRCSCWCPSSSRRSRSSRRWPTGSRRSPHRSRCLPGSTSASRWQRRRPARSVPCACATTGCSTAWGTEPRDSGPRRHRQAAPGRRASVAAVRHPHGPGLVPAPATTRADGVPVRLADGATVRCAPALRPAVRWWRRVTEEAYGIDLVPVTDGAADVVVEQAADLAAGAYRLEVGAADAPGRSVVRVEAADLAGAHAAVQALRQLAGPDAYRR